MRLGLGLLLALGSAAALDWGYLAQHRGASSLPPLAPGRPLRSLRLLVSHRRWLAGFVAGLGGWALYVCALALAPLSLVQSASAGGVGLLALLVARGGTRLSRRERTGVWIAVAGLALLGASLGAGAQGRDASWPALGLWLGGSAAAAALAFGARACGVAAGILYAAGDVATKAAVVHPLLVPAVLAAHGCAFVVLQLGFQRGGALATIGSATLLTNALPIVAATAVFGEGVPDGLRGASRLLAFACTVAGAAALSRSDAVALDTGLGLPLTD